ncbi:hypothetical protein, partial [Nocardia africana]
SVLPGSNTARVTDQMVHFELPRSDQFSRSVDSCSEFRVISVAGTSATPHFCGSFSRAVETTAPYFEKR